MHPTLGQTSRARTAFVCVGSCDLLGPIGSGLELTIDEDDNGAAVTTLTGELIDQAAP
jgi:hypothetical protein